MHAHRRSFWPLLWLLAALAVLFHRLAFGEVFFWGLPALQFYPWREYAFDLLRSGQLPLWNPFNGAGAPLLANYQSALLYPLNWPGLIFPLAWSMSLTAVFHLFLAGAGMWAFAIRLSLSHLGAGVSALAFGLAGYIVARLGTYPIVFAAAWLPWLMWGLLGVLRLPTRRNAAILTCLFALQLLSGHAQTTWYSLLLLGAFTIWELARQQERRLLRVRAVVVAFTLALGISAAQLIPTVELLRASQRSSGVDADFAMNFSYAPARVLNFLSPNIFGTPADGTYATRGAFFEDAVYIGLIPLIGALVAILVWLRAVLRRCELSGALVAVPFWLAIAVTGFILALGKNSPIFPFLYEHVPSFDLFQAPVRWHLWTIFALIVLAGMGVDRWAKGHWTLFATRLALAGAIGAVLLALIAPRFLSADVVAEQGVQVVIRAVVVAGLSVALAATLTLIRPDLANPQLYRRWSWLVLTVVVADLIYASWGLNPMVPASIFDQSERVAETTRAYWPAQIEQAMKFNRFLPFDNYGVAVEQRDDFRASDLPNLNLIDRRPLFNNFDPLLIGSYAAYIETVEAQPSQRDWLLRSVGVGAVYQSDGTLLELKQPPLPAWFLVIMCQGQPSTSTDLQAQGIDLPGLLAEPVMPSESLSDSACPGLEVDETVSRSLVITRPDIRSVQIRLSTERPGVLILTDTAYPGWESEVDGISQSWFTAHGAFRGVELPVGTHEVRFEYRPWWLWPGALLTIVSCMLTLVLWRSRAPGLD